MRFPLRRALPYVLAALGLLLIRQTRLAESVNLMVYDLAVQWRPMPSAAALPIRLVTIEESDLSRLGWPLQDHLLAEAVHRLDRSGVRAIGLDLYRDLGVGEGQEDLRRLARSPGPLISVYSEIDAIGPIPGTPPNRQAYNDLLIDHDGVVRRDLVHVRGQGPSRVALPMRLLEHWRGHAPSPLRARWEKEPGALAPLGANSGGYSDLDHGGLQRLLLFHKPGSFRSWSLHSLLAGQVPADQLRGTIVLIGSRAPSLRDVFSVPLGRLPWAATVSRMSGVDLHAQRLAALMALERGERVGIEAAPGWLNSLLLLVGIGAGLALGEGIRSLRRSVQVVVLLAGAWLILGLILLIVGGFWLNIALPLAGLVALAGAAWLGRAQEHQRQRDQLQLLLGQAISPSVAWELWEQREELLAGDRFRGRECFVTLLLADIEHFTALAEKISPEELLQWLNRAMERLVRAIQREGGLVNKFTGDGLLAVFGTPLGRGAREDALAALRVAVAIRQEMGDLNRELKANAHPPVRLRLGLHSGRVLVGSIGSPERWEYGVVGDVVNCAYRIDTLASQLRSDAAECRILLSGTTRNLVEDGFSSTLVWKSWGLRPLSGRSRQEEIWELVRPQGEVGNT